MRLLSVLMVLLVTGLFIIAPVSAMEEPLDIAITSNVDGAAVYVDGVYFGETPSYFYGKYYGEEHVVEVSAPGYETYLTTASAGTPVYAHLNLIVGPVTSDTPSPVPTKSPVPVIALISGLGVVAFLALRKQ